jgi:hypothetical protein
VVTPENLFSRPVSSATVGQIILWWESRRLYYNGIILGWALLWGLFTQLSKNPRLGFESAVHSHLCFQCSGARQHLLHGRMDC